MPDSPAPFSDSQRAKLLALLNAPSPSGWEGRGQAFWMGEAALLADEVEQDTYGNAWATLCGTDPQAPVLLLEAHADEIGFIVKHVQENGFITLAPIGGSDKTIAAARRLRIFTDKAEVPGVIGNTAIHLRNTDKDKLPEWKDLFVDIGAGSAEEAAALGVRVGCPAVYADTASECGVNRLTGRALDNRLGGFLLLRILELLHAGERPRSTVIIGNAIQEEIGSHGIQMLAHRLNPDAAIVFDVTHATDTPGIDAREHGLVKLGGGPTVAHGAANHPAMVSRLIQLAKDHALSLQHEAISRTTRTDTDELFVTRDGIPSVLISLPLRYMHSPVETADLRDVETAAQLVAAFAREFEPGTRFEARGV